MKARVEKVDILGWNNSSVKMYDKMMHLCLACEGIVCGKRLDMYHFTLIFLADNSPRRQITDLNIVSGDVFFDR